MDNNKDSQGIIVKKFGIVIMVIVIISMITFFNSPITSIVIVALSIFIEILLYALGEIIILLQEIIKSKRIIKG